MSGRAQRSSLWITLAVLLAVAASRWMGTLSLNGEGTALLPAAAAPPRIRGGHPGARPGDRIASLNVAILAGARSGGASGRDPWRFVDPPPVPQSGRSKGSQPEAQAPVAPRPAEPPLPHPDDFTLRYLGRFGPPEKQIAVFTDGTQVFNRQEGEVLDGRFIVSRIAYESVDIRFVGFPEAPARRVGVAGRR